jgi:hypothetical protein
VTESRDIQRSREIYNSAEPEYERHYFDENTGGFVLIHRDHQTTESDRFIARTLANIGRRVKLLSEQAPEGVRTPDADVDGEIYEFKELTEHSKSLRNRVQEGLGKARSQGAKVVVYHINRASYDIEQINRGIRQAFFWDTEQQIQAISLVFQTGEMQTLTREEWENGNRF